MPFVEVGRARLWYEDAGEGPPVVLVHGALVDARMWDAQMKAFTQEHRVVRYDQRWFGRSESVEGCFSWVEDLRGLLDALAIERAALLGLSVGGRVALEFALACPGRVSALALACAGLRDMRWSEAVDGAVADQRTAFERGDLEQAAETFLRTWVDGPFRDSSEVDPQVRERARSMHLGNLLEAVAARSAGTVRSEEEPFEPPASERLGEVQAPTLVVLGELDVPDINLLGERLAAEIPGAWKKVVEGTAHFPNMESPEEFNRVVLDFLHRAVGAG